MLSGRPDGSLPLDHCQHVIDRSVEVVVDEHMVGDSSTKWLLSLCLAETSKDLVVGVTAPAKAALLLFSSWRKQENEHRVWKALFHLLRPVELDLEHHVSSIDIVEIGHRRSVVVTEELGPFDEPSVGDPAFKCLGCGEHIGICGFARTLIASRP